MSRSARDEAKATLASEFQGVGWHAGTISAVAAPTCTITLDGSTVDVPGIAYYPSYTPAVGDPVDVLRFGQRLVVLGKRTA